MKLTLYIGLFLLGTSFAWLIHHFTGVYGLCIIYGIFFSYLGYELYKSPIQEDVDEIEE